MMPSSIRKWVWSGAKMAHLVPRSDALSSWATGALRRGRLYVPHHRYGQCIWRCGPIKCKSLFWSMRSTKYSLPSTDDHVSWSALPSVACNGRILKTEVASSGFVPATTSCQKECPSPSMSSSIQDPFWSHMIALYPSLIARRSKIAFYLKYVKSSAKRRPECGFTIETRKVKGITKWVFSVSEASAVWK